MSNWTPWNLKLVRESVTHANGEVNYQAPMRAVTMLGLIDEVERLRAALEQIAAGADMSWHTNRQIAWYRAAARNALAATCLAQPGQEERA